MTLSCTLSVRHRVAQTHNEKSTIALVTLESGWITTIFYAACKNTFKACLKTYYLKSDLNV